MDQMFAKIIILCMYQAPYDKHITEEWLTKQKYLLIKGSSQNGIRLRVFSQTAETQAGDSGGVGASRIY